MLRTTLLIVLAFLPARCQDARQTFEVASIKPAPQPTGAMVGHHRFDNAAFEESSASLLELLTVAYHTVWTRVSGPNWLNEQYFSVAAKVPTGSTKEQIPGMLQTLLADRFKLSVHHDQRVESVYLLVPNRAGMKLKQASGDDSPLSGCNSRPGQYSCRNVTLAQLAEHLSGMAIFYVNTPSLAAAADDGPRNIDHPVVDRTGLTGSYDIDLQWFVPGLTPGRGRGANLPVRDPSVKATSIFGAIEATGLKLQPGKHAFDILVVDHVERVPTEN